jgi:WD40 repeat protein
MGLPDDASPPPEAKIQLDFPLVARGQIIYAKIAHWSPQDLHEEGDIAGLELISDPPEGATVARLLMADDLWRHEFRTFGFPSGYDDGVWASGRLLGRQAIKWVQMEDVKQTGYRIEQGFSGAPVWDNELNGVIGMTVAADVRPETRTAYLIPSSVLVNTWPLLSRQVIPPSPYRGLMAFREQDSPVFYGREKLTDQLVQGVIRRPFTAVIGSSGSGKSSLVFAGLLSRLRRRSDWVMASVRFGGASIPLEALAAALLPLLEPRMSEAERLRELPILTTVLRNGQLGDVVGRIAEKNNADRVLIVIDQFEELFTLEPFDRNQCIDLLLQAAQSRPSVFRVVVTLRVDFLSQALGHAELTAALQNSSLMVGPMTREQLRRVIEAPAASQATYEKGLVERILHDVGEEPGNLPSMEFAITLLWERQANGRLTHEAYDALGGVGGALAQHAEEVNLRLPASEREDTHQIFLQLVRPGEGTEYTRRVAHRIDLSERRWSLAQRLTTSRLVVTSRTVAGTETIELVHEALISRWDRLRIWIEADHAFRVWQERLRSALQQWDTSGRDAEALLRGMLLAESERWLEQRRADIGEGEQRFIEQSQSHQGRRVRRLRQLAVVLTLLTVVAAALAGLALERGRRAEQQSRLAISRYLVSEADARVDTEPDLAILLTLAAFSTEKTTEARKSLLEQSFRRRDASALLTGHSDSVSAVAFSPDGILASGGADGMVILWDAARHTRLATLRGHERAVTTVSFSPDGRILASGGADGMVILWDAARHTRLATLRGQEGGVVSVAFSPDGHLLASGGNAHEIILWDVTRRTQLTTLRGVSEDVLGIAFSPDGHLLASGGYEHGITLWDVTRRTQLTTLVSEAVLGIAFSPDGRGLAIATSNGLVLWDVGKRKRIGVFTGSDSGSLMSNSVAYSPNGQVIAALNRDNSVALWDVKKRRRLRVLVAQTGSIRDLAFSSDGRFLAAASDDRTIALFDANPSSQVGGLTGEPKGDIGFAASIAFRPDGRVLASIDGNVISLWDATRHIRLATLRGGRKPFLQIAFSHHGRTLLSSSADEVVLWDTSTHERTSSFHLRSDAELSGSMAFSPDRRTIAVGGNQRALWDIAKGNRVGTLDDKHRLEQLAFSPDGRTLATAADDGTVILWDVARQTKTASLELEPGFFAPAVAFSPDGRLLATADERHISLWDVARRTRLESLGSEAAGFPFRGQISLAFSPDGQVLAIGSEEGDGGSIAIWDLASSASVTHLEGAGNVIAFGPDGQTMAFRGNSIIIWDMNGSVWFKHLCDIVGRNLTQAEWKQFLPKRRYQKTCM